MTWEADRDAAAKALDPIAFWPRRRHSGGNPSTDYWEHIRSRRKNARHRAAQVMQELEKRGWRVPTSGRPEAVEGRNDASTGGPDCPGHNGNARITQSESQA